MSTINDIFHTFFSLVRKRPPRGLLSAILPAVAIVTAVPCRGQEAETPAGSRPMALMTVVPGTLSDNPELFAAIRAQLSGLAFNVERIETEDEAATGLSAVAAQEVEARGAAMVFWIESDAPVRLVFYIPGADGGRIIRRTLEIDSSSRLSRFEVIALAVTGMAEGVLFGPQRIVEPPPPPISPEPTPPPPEYPPRKRRLVELQFAYTGAYFAEEAVVHGGLLGIGVLPLKHFALNAAFFQHFPYDAETERLRLRMLSRGAEISAAGIVAPRAWELRLGLAASVTFVTYSPQSLVDTVDAAAEGLSAAWALMPFVSVARLFSDRVGIFALLGADIALNESDYRIKEAALITTVLSPFTAKLTWRFGMTVRF